MGIGLGDVGLQSFFVELVKPATPDHVVHPAMETQLVPFPLHRLERGDEIESDRSGERGLQNEARPSRLLDEMHRFAIGQLGTGAYQALPQPFAQVGRPAHVDEEGVGDAEILAHCSDLRQAVGDAYAMIHVPAKDEAAVLHRVDLAPMSR